jgi:hypothetical protein
MLSGEATNINFIVSGLPLLLEENAIFCILLEKLERHFKFEIYEIGTCIDCNFHI